MIPYDQLARRALFLYENSNIFPTLADFDVEEIYELLVNLEKDKIERDKVSDQHIEYNDEIVDIVECGEEECIDISVTGDNLFYANGVLTKNSFGLPATLDAMFAIINTDEMKALGQIMIKQLKNRFADLEKMKRFVIGIDKMKMRLYDVEERAQADIDDNDPVFDETPSGQRDKPKKFDKKKFEDFR